MTGWRVRATLQPEPTKSKDRGTKSENEDGRESATGDARIDAEIARASGRPSLAGAIKRLFREVMHSITRRAPSPTLKAQRRRKTEETGRRFRLVARKVFRRVFRMPVTDLYAPELWEWNDPYVGHLPQDSQDLHSTEANHLSPHP
jgi:hypothetical protein